MTLFAPLSTAFRFFALLTLVVCHGASAETHSEQTAAQTYDVSFSVQPVADARAASVDVQWGRGEGGDCYTLRLDSQGAKLGKLAGGREQRIAASRELRLPCPGEPARDVLIARRPDRVWVEADGERVFTCFDGAHFAGGIEVTSEGATVSDFRLRELDELHFGDDFLRDPSSPGEWESVQGQWQLSVYRDPLIQRDGGPIGASWYESTGKDANLAAAGYDFWGDVRLATSCRSDGAAALGLVFNCQGPDDYCLARLSPERAAELLQVRRGEKRLLKRAPAEWAPGCWQRLEVTTWDRAARVALNGQPVLSADGLSLAHGRIGLYAEGAGAQFDDLAMDSAVAFWDDFSSGSAYRWDAVSGEPLMQDGRLRLRADGKGVALARTRPWDSYSVQCRVTDGRGEAGIVFGWAAPEDFWSFQCGKGGEWLLKRHAPDGITVVAKGTLAVTGTEHSVRVTVDGELVECCLDGRFVNREASPSGARGRWGLIADGPVLFADVQGAGGGVPRAPLFATDFSQTTVIGKNKGEEWRVVGDLLGRAAGRWTTPTRGDPVELVGTANRAPAVIRFRDPLAGDVSLSCEFDDASTAASIALLGTDPASGYAAHLAENGRRLELLRRGQVVAACDLTALGGEAGGSLQLERVGRHFVARCGEQAVAYRDEAPLTAELAALVVEQGSAAVREFAIEGRNALAYPFDRIEPDWRPVSGDWRFHSGMTCIPWNYWITGDGRGQPALQWNRVRLPADLDLDFYVSEHTEGEENGSHFHFPYHDISVVLSGDGQSLDSGYRVLLGANGGHGSVLYRKGEAVAKSAMPVIVMGSHCNEPRQLRVHLRKEKSKLTVTANGTVLFALDDAEPLGEGYLALGASGCRANFSDFYLAALRTWENQLPAPLPDR